MPLRQAIFRIPINPIAWMRAGVNRKHFWDQQAQDKVSLGLMLNRQFSGEPFSKPVAMDIVFLMQRPKNPTKCSVPTKTDIDNLEKFILDCLTSANIWTDDRNLCAVNKYKIWANDQEGYFFVIREVDVKEITKDAFLLIEKYNGTDQTV